MSGKTDPGTESVERWEYTHLIHVMQCRSAGEDFSSIWTKKWLGTNNKLTTQEYVTSLGEQGWELVSTVLHERWESTFHLLYIFKRRLNDDQAEARVQ